MGNSDDTSKEPPSPNPLLFPEVVCRVFEWLPPADLRHCCFVCRIWNTVGKTYMGIEVRIPYKKRVGIKRVERFGDTFSLMENTDCIKFYKNQIEQENLEFGIQSGRCCTLFNNCRNPRNENIEELHFKGINLLMINRQKTLLKCYDLSPLFFRNITKLTIVGQYKYNEPLYTTTVISFDLMCDALSSLNILRLLDCQLHTTKDTPSICLEELDLLAVEIIKDGEKLNEVNEIFDFTHTKIIRMKSEFYIDGVMVLDMGVPSAVTFTNIYLSNVVPLNWNTSQWKVNKMTLEDIYTFKKYEENEICEMTIKELEIINCDQISPSFLPTSIERLQIVRRYATEFFRADNPYNLRHLEDLKYLCLIGFHCYMDIEAEFINFHNCLSLTEVHFGNEIHCRLTADMVHNTFEKILSDPHRYGSDFGGNVGWEQLVDLKQTSHTHHPYVISYMTKLTIGVTHSKRVVISLPHDMEQHAFDRIFDLNVIRGLQKSKVIVVGPMKWNCMFKNLGNIETSNGDDNKKKFFIFQQNVGSKIEQIEFKNNEKEVQCAPCKNNLNVNFDKRFNYSWTPCPKICCGGCGTLFLRVR